MVNILLAIAIHDIYSLYAAVFIVKSLSFPHRIQTAFLRTRNSQETVQVCKSVSH